MLQGWQETRPRKSLPVRSAWVRHRSRPQSSSAFARFTAGASGLLKLSLPVARLVTWHSGHIVDAHHSPSADPTLSPASRRVVDINGLNADRSHAVTTLPVSWQ